MFRWSCFNIWYSCFSCLDVILNCFFISASVTVALQILTKGEMKDDWFQLRASHSRIEAGTVRIKARYMVRLCYTNFYMIFYTIFTRFFTWFLHSFYMMFWHDFYTIFIYFLYNLYIYFKEYFSVKVYFSDILSSMKWLCLSKNILGWKRCVFLAFCKSHDNRTALSCILRRVS